MPDPDDDPDPTDSDLLTEAHHLDESRAALHRMRERTASLQAEGANPVDTEYLKAALWRRMRDLEDDPDVPLFFGRLDTDEHETLHIGRRHVSDVTGDPMVIDWRAPVSRPFYRATAADPQGVRLRRRFGFTAGRLTGYEDEPLSGPAARDRHSDILDAEIERPRTGPMRDIVATIQPEQDQLVRADVATSLCVQGAPGTGKTAVGLHRAAFLLYAFRDRLSRSGVLVIGPNDSFLRYIADVLPALGEIDARQTTIEELVAHPKVRIRGVDDDATARLKGDARMATVLRRAVWSRVGTPAEALVVPRGAARWRVPAYEAEPIVAELKGRGLRYSAARDLLAQRLAHAILMRMEQAGESPDDRVQTAVARSRPVRQYVDAVWPALKPDAVLFDLFSDRGSLATHADDVLDVAEQERLLWATTPRSPGSVRWTPADAVLLDELRDLLDRTPSLGHVVLDEAQDLSAMQLRAVGRRCSTGSVTVLGDLAQGTTSWASESWTDALGHLGHADAVVQELTAGYRVPGAVIEYAARLLPRIAPTLAPPTAVRRSAGELSLAQTGDLWPAIVEATTRAAARPGTTGVIVAEGHLEAARTALRAADLEVTDLGEATDATSRLDLVPARLAKGLEFDHVVLVEPAAIVAAEPDERTGLRRLYVCLTRAVSGLTVVHTQAVPVPDAA